MDRIKIIEERLQRFFSPEKLIVTDDSDQHRGHEGSRDGAGHYTVEISAACFKDKSRVEVHREIYRVLDDLIPHEIHALRIVVA